MKKNVMVLTLLLLLLYANFSHSKPELTKTWLQYVSHSNATTSLIDFSNVGVNYSNNSITTLSLPTFSVVDYGAVPNDMIEDGVAIQNTINAAQKAGGGIIQFPSGRFLINEQANRNQGLVISQSNIILRGSNELSNPTELFMRHHLLPADPNKKWTVPAMITFKPKNSRGLTSNSDNRQYIASTIITEDSLINSPYVTVADSSIFNEGDMVTFEMENVEANSEYLKNKPSRTVWTRIKTQGVMVAENHQIKEIIGKRLYFEQPTLTNIKSRYGWKIGSVPSISHVGMENIQFIGNFTEPFVHHKNFIHDSGYTAVKLIRTNHSWIKNNKFVNVSSAVNIEGGLANSVLLNVIEGNSGHFSFGITFGTRNLIGLNIDNTLAGQWHGPGASHLSVGNVIWKFYSLSSRGIDSHAVFPRHTLFDSVTAHGFGGWGGNYTALPNHLEGLVIWNYKQTGDFISKNNPNSLDFWQLPKNDKDLYGFLTAVNPILVGYQGTASQVNQENLSVLDSHNIPANPPSLFEAHLHHRLGKTPQWITSMLNEWLMLKKNYEQ